MKEISRREFLKLSAVVVGAEFFRSITPLSPDIPEEPQPKKLPFEEILKCHPQINPKITAVNLSCIPEKFVGQNVGFHHPQESLVMTIPYNDIKKGEINIYGYAPGIKEAAKRRQKVVLVLENPHKPENYDPQSWRQGVEKIAEYFQGASIFIIGNEINIPNSPWSDSLDKYQELYLVAYQKIKTISPKSLVFPWQEAYYGKGEVLQEFLSKEEVKDKVDGLAFNFYGTSEKIEERVGLYQQILNQSGLSQLPVIISELGKPGFKPTNEQQARLVVQNLAMAAYLEKQGKIDLSAWYSAYVGPDNEHALSYSTAKEFKPKPGLFAFLLAQRLLVGDEINLVKNPSGLVEVNVSNQGKPTACFVWNEGERVTVVSPKPGCRQVWKPTGEKLFEKPFSYFPIVSIVPIVLRPSSNPSVFPGDTAIFVF